MLALAKERLRRVDFVGLASRFLDSMTLLSWWLGLPPLNVTCSANMDTKLGVTDAGRAGGGAMRLTAEGIAIAERQNALDVELYRFAEALFEERWQLMLAEAPERIQADRYQCHGSGYLRCLPPDRIHGDYYTRRRRCFTYCTNRATEQAPIGASLHRAYESGCTPPDPAHAAHTQQDEPSGPTICSMLGVE